ncbi:deoxyguanosinetriphosphate triphosphohydrolase [Clostridiaceae bacterium Marseille-Q4145]|nr:deoxyguanosinetriphosphate triphosphohydrolase [Clostridiaceae bacterium Marseille-Q4145]
MTIRESTEQWESQWLSPYASLSRNSRGREKEEPECDIRPVYQRDRDRILHCKSFRRLKHKTQVFLTPQGDHYRTRLTHTLEVAQTARTIARALRLNEDLTEAIALGHDLGHTPFGHAGERALNQVCSEGFAHHQQSVRIVERLEKGGKGLNLTWEVRDGISNHQMSGKPSTLEGKIVRYSDKIAYINHDVDDAIRAGVIRENEIPRTYTDILGHSTRERLNTMIHDIVNNSLEKPDIRMSEDVEFAFRGMRKYMFENVYTNPKAKGEEEKAENILKELFRYYMDHPERLSNEYIERMWQTGETQERSVCDYIAGMTDQYAIAKFQEFFVPVSWRY